LHRAGHKGQDVERVAVIVRSCVSRHHSMTWVPFVPFCAAIMNGNREAELLDLTETKELPEEPGEIVHLGHDDVLLLSAAMTLGADWNEGRAEWVFLIIWKGQKHLMGRPRFLIFLGALEIDCCGGVESSRACEPNPRSGNRADAFDENEP